MKISTSYPTETGRRLIASLIMLIGAILFLSGCTATTQHRHHDYQNAPTPSVSIEYQYFPDADVYYDIHRQVYHYHHARRGWVSVTNLPRHINIDKRRHHVVRSSHHQPWKHGHANKHHRRHDDPPRPRKQDHRRQKDQNKSSLRHDSRREQTPHQRHIQNKVAKSNSKVNRNTDTRKHNIRKKVLHESQHENEKELQKTYRQGEQYPKKVRTKPRHEQRQRGNNKQASENNYKRKRHN